MEGDLIEKQQYLSPFMPPEAKAGEKKNCQIRSPKERRQTALICLALAAITFAVFGQTLHHGFVNFDDRDYVYENPTVSRGLTAGGMAWAFSFHAYNWHPLTWLSHMLDCQMYGMRPGGHHLTSILLHAASAIALFLILRQMTGAGWRSAFVAAVFAIHPLRVESVAWVAERKDVLSGLFFMLTIAAYVWYVRQPRRPWRYGLVALLMALGLMCKPMLVTLPLVLLTLDYWPLQRMESAGKLVREKLPLLALSAASCLMTLLAQDKAIQSIQSYSLTARLANALVSCADYLRQMVFPAGLAVFYPYPPGGIPAWEAVCSGGLLIGIFAAAWALRRAQPWLWAGWLWYLIMLLPVVGIVQVGGQAHADRYVYLPQIGIYLALTWSAGFAAKQWRITEPVLGCLAIGVIGALMICSWKQTTYWRNSETLWTHTIACTADNELAHYNLGIALDEQGKLDEAMAQYQEALKIRPSYPAAENNLGLALQRKGALDEAIAHFQKAIQGAGFVEPIVNLGNALLQKGEVEEAIVQYQQAVRLAPNLPTGHNNLGNALVQKGDLEGAAAQYEKALDLDPEYADANYSLGNILLGKGKLDEAIAHFEQSLRNNPDYAKAHNNLGNALLQKGDAKQAVAHYKRALQLEPSDVAIENNLAWLLATWPEASLRDGGGAVELAAQANAITRGGNPMVLRTLAAALAETRRFDEAAATIRKAMALARATGQEDMAAQLGKELKRYENRLPFANEVK